MMDILWLLGSDLHIEVQCSGVSKLQELRDKQEVHSG
jgi:hypothetical protein